MPNGGAICCFECAHLDSSGEATDWKCKLYGTEASPFILCREFRVYSSPSKPPEESRFWSILETLEPDVLYKINNEAGMSGLAPRHYRSVSRIR
jgi:hypothetical protein